MNLEAINKWLDNEYGCSYTRLEELHDFYFEKYCDLKKENKQLQERIEYLERSNNRREDTILEQRQKIGDLEDNWNKLKEWASNFYNSEEVGWAGCGMRYTLEKMQELEGSDK